MPLTRNQRRGFLAAWGGWALDGLDSFIYALVMVPALRELLPRTGLPATTANVGYYGSLLFRTSPDSDADLPVLFALPLRRSHCRQRLAASHLPPLSRNRHRR